MSPQEVVSVDGIHRGKSFDEAITNGSKYKMAFFWNICFKKQRNQEMDK